MQSVCCLDIGTFKTRSVLAVNDGGIPKIIKLFEEKTSGLRRGTIVDLTEAHKNIVKILNEVKKIDKKAVNNIYVNVGTTEARIHRSMGATGISSADSEISLSDIEKVKKMSEAINLGPNRVIIHNIFQEFIIDGVGGIYDPLGFSGSRLEVRSLIIEGFSPYIQNIKKIISLAGGKYKGMIFNPISSSRSVLSKTQKELGVVLIDLGAGTTSLAVYYENKLIHIANLPIGSLNITSDIAIGLKIPYEIAEKIKIKEGVAMPKLVGVKENINLGDYGLEDKSIISRRFLAEIIEARILEILELINKELKLIDKNIELGSGAVLVGGGSKIKGLVDLVKNELKLSAQIGIPLEENIIYGEGISLADPEYANVLGLVLWAEEIGGWQLKAGSWEEKLIKFLRSFKP